MAEHDQPIAADYASRCEMVTEVLAVFHRDRKFLEEHCIDEQNPTCEFYDVGLSTTHPDCWIARWNIAEQRFVRIFMDETVLLPNGMKASLCMNIIIPEELGGRPDDLPDDVDPDSTPE